MTLITIYQYIAVGETATTEGEYLQREIRKLQAVAEEQAKEAVERVDATIKSIDTYRSEA
jgi:hypothetical protein